MSSSSSAAPTVDFASGDHYAVLGVPRNASEADIAKAYKTLALRYHPDKNQGSKEDAEVSFKRIAEAYAVLRSAEKRREYDRTGGVRSYVSYDEAEQMWRRFASSEDGGEARAAVQEELDGRRKAMGLILVLASIFLAPRLLTQLLPGLTAAVVGVALLSRRDNPAAAKWAWCALALLLAGYAVPWAVRVRSSLEARPLNGAQLPTGSAAAGPAVPVGIPHSGEEVLMSDGRFLRLADPTKHASGEQTANEGWQQRLLGDMTTAIQKGQEQVLMVFSRQGCPWCDRQLPVLQRAIERRSGPSRPTNDVEAPTAFLVPGASRAAVGMNGPAPGANGGLLFAPLRIFVFDAEEFPQMAQTFKVEAFPTSIAWGPPGVTPMAAQGYLDDGNLDELLRTVATGGLGQAAGGGAKRRGLFR